ncbi:hypothetical protein [Escherichia coli]|uniref:hypothetical protein n=2 Tax=Escherichia coli TaxID=562 RepID=UPI0010767CD2|nr:hypothetical protein [Escherichia coli]EET9518540.1 hypothetical protein [Escherichia coli]EFN1058372.1 hypothetical protein [Escherichia coli]TFW80705.1 hypothetical protein DEO18_25285 [Escherichia coli]
MLQIVGALILLIAGFAILRLLFRALISTASALAGLILLCLFGPALLAGYITERITRLFHIRWLAGVFLTIAGMIISFMWGLDGKHIALEAHTFDSVKFILTTALAGGLLAVPLQIKNIQQNGITPEDISKEINGYYCCFYTAFFLMACSACAPLIALQYDISPSLMWWGGLLYWLAALVTLLWAASQIQALKKLTCAISQTLEEQPVLNSKSWLTSLQNDYSLPDSLTERIWLTLISQRISRGHLTYTQARNITRFGTIESVTYDIAEGSVVSLAAGGISFALTASVFWLSTGERDAALQTAAVQAGKTFTRTLAVYVTTQQLHRLSVVQGMLKHIDFSTASPTVRLALQKGTGAGNISALNKVMKGTLVTSLALVAVTTGPDMIKMLRGRISGTQFIRNLAVASSGVAGGAVGSVAGGILFSPLGPFGALTGRVVGGVLGGMIASAVSGKIAGALVEEDRVKILAMIQEQVTWLAGSFLLTGHEIENLNENLARVIDQNALEIIFAAGIQQRAATNMLIKPLVVSIIRQRPVMEYDASHLGNMVNRLEEALPPELPA